MNLVSKRGIVWESQLACSWWIHYLGKLPWKISKMKKRVESVGVSFMDPHWPSVPIKGYLWNKELKVQAGIGIHEEFCELLGKSNVRKWYAQKYWTTVLNLGMLYSLICKFENLRKLCFAPGEVRLTVVTLMLKRRWQSLITSQWYESWYNSLSQCWRWNKYLFSAFVMSTRK